ELAVAGHAELDRPAIVRSDADIEAVRDRAVVERAVERRTQRQIRPRPTDLNARVRLRDCRRRATHQDRSPKYPSHPPHSFPRARKEARSLPPPLTTTGGHHNRRSTPIADPSVARRNARATAHMDMFTAVPRRGDTRQGPCDDLDAGLSRRGPLKIGRAHV